METTTKAKRTAGEASVSPAGCAWAIQATAGFRVAKLTDGVNCPPAIPSEPWREVTRGEQEANARTMALAIGAANAVDAMGLDGDAADIAVRAGAILARLRPADDAKA